MGLFKPAWQGKNEEKALAYIEKCTDQDKLLEIAKAPVSPARRKAAIARLTDPQALYGIAAAEYSTEYACLAAEKLTDPALLEKLALHAGHREVRRDAVLRLTDRETLARAALEDEETMVRLSAVRRLAGQDDVLRRIALEDGSALVRKAALERISDPALRAEAGAASPDAETRIAAIREGVAESRLEELAVSDPHAAVRRAARERLTDMEKRIELSLADREYSDARIWGLRHLPRDDDRLLEYAVNDRDYDVRAAALGRMDTREMLLEAARKGADTEHVMTRLRDLGELDDAALQAIAAGPNGENAALTLDKRDFRARMEKARKKRVLSAYDAKDVQALRALANPDAAEAAILLLREFGEAENWPARPSELAYAISDMLHELYGRGDPALRTAVLRARPYTGVHGDQGNPQCHIDEGPLCFRFQ